MNAPAGRARSAYVVDFGRARVLVTAPEGLKDLFPNAAPPAMPYVAGFTIVADVDAALRFFAEARVPVDQHRDGFFIGPENACGVSIRFEHR